MITSLPIKDHIPRHLIYQNPFRIFDIIDSFILFILDVTNKKIVYVSETVKSLLGYSSEDFISGGISLFYKLVIPDDYLKVKRYFINNILTLKKWEEPELFDFRMEHKNGEPTWMEFKFFKNVELDDGRRYSIGILKEITRQKQQERFLLENLEENVGSANKLRKIKREYHKLFNDRSVAQPPMNMGIHDKLSLRINGKLRSISKREKEVMELIAFGYSSKQIASILHISYHTVVSHRKNLIAKFQVRNTAELINKALNSFCL